MLVHCSINLRHHSIRIIIAVEEIFGYLAWTQDVSQAYLESSEALMSDVFVRTPKELKLTSDQLLKLLKSVYWLT